MEICICNEYHNPNVHRPDYTLWFSNSWQQFRKSGVPGRDMLLLPSPMVSGLFLHTTIWQTEQTSQLPLWNKGSRNQKSSCAFPAWGREQTAFAAPSSFPKPLLNTHALAGCSDRSLAFASWYQCRWDVKFQALHSPGDDASPWCC